MKLRNKKTGEIVPASNVAVGIGEDGKWYDSLAILKEVYKECKSYAETGRALNISAGVVSQIVREIPGPYYERAKNARA